MATRMTMWLVMAAFSVACAKAGPARAPGVTELARPVSPSALARMRLVADSVELERRHMGYPKRGPVAAWDVVPGVHTEPEPTEEIDPCKDQRPDRHTFGCEDPGSGELGL